MARTPPPAIHDLKLGQVPEEGVDDGCVRPGTALPGKVCAHASQTERRDLEGLYLPVPKILPRGYSMAVGLGRERITDILERSGTARTDR